MTNDPQKMLHEIKIAQSEQEKKNKRIRENWLFNALMVICPFVALGCFIAIFTVNAYFIIPTVICASITVWGICICKGEKGNGGDFDPSAQP